MSRLPGGPTLSSWGRMTVPGREHLSEDLAAATRGAVLTRGLGRAYGDAALPPPSGGRVAGSRLADRILAWDPATGRLRAEAGLSLVEINRLFLRRGWFVPVTPGTQFVTLGGMVAADVHGKNHHVDGDIGEHVTALRLRLADGNVLEISRAQEPELFAATLGGMGLTGHILEVELPLRRIPSPWILEETERIADLDRFVEATREAGKSWPMTVGWIDALATGRSLGRGILMKGRWAEAAEAPPTPPPHSPRLALPFDCPEFLLGTTSVRLFNELFFRRAPSRRHRRIVSPDAFFYPLDALLEWNRLYGRRGFIQYQCVIPERSAVDGVRRVLEIVAAEGAASFLSVLKDCGAEGTGILSFPLPGVSLALDLPLRDRTAPMVHRLNDLVASLGGRVYLAKDRFTTPEHFRAMEPRLPRFLAVRDRWDPQRRIRSAQSVRLFGDPE